MYTNNFGFEDKLSELSELEDSFCQGEKISCSTPVKLENVRSYSLIDLTCFEEELFNKKKLTTSTETIGSDSQGSVCKDSGYVNSESNTSLNSAKEHKRLSDLIQDLKFKDVLITELQESNHSLRLKYAEAENRIAELRIKCESHCDCCNLKTIPNKVQISVKNDVEPVVTQSKDIDSNTTYHRHQYKTNENIKPLPVKKINSSTSIPYVNDDSVLKVKRWQDSNNSLNSLSSDTSSCDKRNYGSCTKTRPFLLPLPVAQTKMIGDRSVRISPTLTNHEHLPTNSSMLYKQISQNICNETNGKNRRPTENVTLFENVHKVSSGNSELPVIIGKDKVPKYSLLSDNKLLRKNNPTNLCESNNQRLSENNDPSFSFGKKQSIRSINHKLHMERTIIDGMNGIAEKGKLESGMSYKPWELESNLNKDNFNSKTGMLEFTL